MDNSFLIYLERLAMMAFFSGYPLVYALAHFVRGNKPAKNNFKQRLVSLLPYEYALVGSLYLGFQFKKLYPDYTIAHINQIVQEPFMAVWAILSILFWIPFLAKKTMLSLIHSLFFFFFFAKDLYLQFAASSPDKHMVSNDMNVYTVSLLLNIAALFLIVFFSFLYNKYKKVSDL